MTIHSGQLDTRAMPPIRKWSIVETHEVPRDSVTKLVTNWQNTQKLQIINSDPIGHNTKIEGDPGGGAAGANPNVGANSSVMYEPIGYSNQPFKVSCSIHNWMDAYMLVRPNPFFAISDGNGDFEIPHIPAGVNLEFRVSHEGRYLDEKNGRVVLTLNDEPLPIKSGRIKLSGINPGDELKLKFVLDAKANDWQ